MGGNRAVTSQPHTGQSTSYGDVKSSYGGAGGWGKSGCAKGALRRAHRQEEQHRHTERGSHTTRDKGEHSRQGGGAQQGRRGNQNSGNRELGWRGWESVCMGGSDNKGDGLASQPRRYQVPGQPLLNWHQVGGVSRSPDGLFAQQEREPIRGRPAVRGKRTYGGRPGHRVEEQGTWASRTQNHSEAGYGRPVDRGAWTAKTVKRLRQQPAHPQYANYWAPLTRNRHTMPHSAQPQQTNSRGSRTRKRHQQEHQPQQPTESSDPTQHAKGRTGDCPGPRKGATTRRNVTQGGEGRGLQGTGAAARDEGWRTRDEPSFPSAAVAAASGRLLWLWPVPHRPDPRRAGATHRHSTPSHRTGGSRPFQRCAGARVGGDPAAHSGATVCGSTRPPTRVARRRCGVRPAIPRRGAPRGRRWGPRKCGAGGGAAPQPRGGPCARPRPATGTTTVAGAVRYGAAHDRLACDAGRAAPEAAASRKWRPRSRTRWRTRPFDTAPPSRDGAALGGLRRRAPRSVGGPLPSQRAGSTTSAASSPPQRPFVRVPVFAFGARLIAGGCCRPRPTRLGGSGRAHVPPPPRPLRLCCARSTGPRVVKNGRHAA